MSSKNLIAATLPFKFKLRQIVIHKNGDAYVVTGLPNEYRIEATGEPAYAYRKLNKDGFTVTGCKWIRAQSVMEDEGRYVATKSYIAEDIVL